jgi:hypothetical protein
MFIKINQIKKIDVVMVMIFTDKYKYLTYGETKPQ